MRQIFSWINRLLQSSEWRLSLWSMLFGPGGFVTGLSAIAVWATWATDSLKTYAPLSYVVVGIGAAVFLSAAYLMFTKASEWRQLWKFRQAAFDTSRVNPLETYFQRQRIRVVDLAAPVGGRISGKTFIDCDILGPVNVMFGLTCTFHGNSGAVVDGLIVRDGMPPSNGFWFDACTFRNCRFYLMTFMVPETDFPGSVFAYWGGINWITDLPGGALISPPSAAASDTQSRPSTE